MRLPPLAVVVERLELLLAELRLPPLLVLALLRLELLPERLVEALLRLELLLEREVEVVALERFEELLELALERLEEPLLRLELLPEMVPPTALEVEDDERLLLLTELLREELDDEDERDTLELEELPRDDDDEDDEREEDVWLEDERLLPPLLDWALTVQGASAIATAAAAESASLKKVFIMLNFSFCKYKCSNR